MRTGYQIAAIENGYVVTHDNFQNGYRQWFFETEMQAVEYVQKLLADKVDELKKESENQSETA